MGIPGTKSQAPRSACSSRHQGLLIPCYFVLDYAAHLCAALHSQCPAAAIYCAILGSDLCGHRVGECLHLGYLMQRTTYPWLTETQGWEVKVCYSQFLGGSVANLEVYSHYPRRHTHPTDVHRPMPPQSRCLTWACHGRQA